MQAGQRALLCVIELDYRETSRSSDRADPIAAIDLGSRRLRSPILRSARVQAGKLFVRDRIKRKGARARRHLRAATAAFWRRAPLFWPRL